jgi:hypothetical protein
MANVSIPNLPAGIALFGPELFECVQGGSSVRVTATQIAAFSLVSLTLQSTPSYANDAAAAVGGVPIGGFYRNGSVVQIRVA